MATSEIDLDVLADKIVERLHRGEDYGKPVRIDERYRPYWIDPRYAPWPYTGPYHVYPYWNPVTCDTRTHTAVNTGPNLTSWNEGATND